jgi:hypothetical protein
MTRASAGAWFGATGLMRSANTVAVAPKLGSRWSAIGPFVRLS